MSTLTLYGPTNKLSINTLKIRVALAEAGAAYQYVPVDLTRGEQRRPAFLAINPHGKVPVLVDGDFALPESDAILWYLAESFPQAALLGATPRARARALEWCDFASTTLYAAYYDLHTHTLSAPVDKRIPAVAEAAGQRLERGLRVLEQVLGQRRWLADTYSIADIANAVVLRGLRDRLPARYDEGASPHTEGWYRRVTARPAWTAALTS
jgi:glutathione S-transferase